MLPKSKIYLSPSEMLITQMSAKTDLSGRQMADKLFVAVKTIKYHLTNIYKKFGVKSRIELVQNYVKKGSVFDVLENPEEHTRYITSRGRPRKVPYPPAGLE